MDAYAYVSRLLTDFCGILADSSTDMLASPPTAHAAASASSPEASSSTSSPEASSSSSSPSSSSPSELSSSKVLSSIDKLEMQIAGLRRSSLSDDPTIIFPRIVSSPSIPRTSPFDALKSLVHVYGGRHHAYHGLQGKEYFSHKRNVANAMSSVLLKVSKDTNFQPGVTGIITDNDLYNRFTEALPLMYFEDGQGFQRTCLIDLDGDIEQFVNAVNANLGLGMCSGIPNALRRLLPTSLANESQRRWLLQLITIKQVFENCPVVLQIGQLSLTLRKNGDKVAIDPQTATLVVTGYIADEHSFEKLAPRLEKTVEKKTLQNLIDTLSTKRVRVSEERTRLPAA